jgi:hypothetical protein
MNTPKPQYTKRIGTANPYEIIDVESTPVEIRQEDILTNEMILLLESLIIRSRWSKEHASRLNQIRELLMV